MILIIGIPNAGKTTFSKKYPNAVHFDDIGGGRHRRDKVIEMVRKNNGLCVDGVYGKADDRKRLAAASKEKNVCIWLDTPVETCLDREINGRKRSTHMVQWSADSFEPPTLDEGWDEIVIIRGDEEEHIRKDEKCL